MPGKNAFWHIIFGSGEWLFVFQSQKVNSLGLIFGVAFFVENSIIRYHLQSFILKWTSEQVTHTKPLLESWEISKSERPMIFSSVEMYWIYVAMVTYICAQSWAPKLGRKVTSLNPCSQLVYPSSHDAMEMKPS